MKRILSIMLVCLFTVAAFCGCQLEQTGSDKDPEIEYPEINPQLLSLLPDIMDEENTQTAHEFMYALSSAYAKYVAGAPLLIFIDDVENALNDYEPFLNMIRNALSDCVKSESDPTRKEAAASLQIKATVSLMRSKWIMYRFDMEQGQVPTYTEAEIQQALYDAINSLSTLFYEVEICHIEQIQPENELQPTQAATEPQVPFYPKGNFTTSGYSSQWLDLRYNAFLTFETTDYNIQETQNYNEMVKSSDPYSKTIDMQYYWVGTENSALAIYITPIQHKEIALSQMVDDLWAQTKEHYMNLRSYGYDIRLDWDENKTIEFLGNDYILLHYQVVSTDFTYNQQSHWEYWSLYRIKDDHLVEINFSSEYQVMSLDDFLSLFTSYDGTQSYQKPIPAHTGGQTDNGLFNVLGYHKVWAMDYYFGGYFYKVYFVFEEDGTCYYALADHNLWDAGKGTYTVNDYSLSIELSATGNQLSCIFSYDPVDNKFINSSIKTIIGYYNDSFVLYEDTEMPVENVIAFGNDYAYKKIEYN